MFLIVRTPEDPAQVTTLVRSRLGALDSDIPVSHVRTMDQLLSESVTVPRFRMLLLATFAGLALLLAALGIYGVLAYAVARRTHEIGVRVALGAQQRDVLSLVLRHGMRLALIGIVIGVAGAFSLTRLMASLLFGVTAADHVIFVIVPLMLLGVALAACYFPARRAMRVDPMVALRYE
jgi:putative ABC transport system permease protein